MDHFIVLDEKFSIKCRKLISLITVKSISISYNVFIIIRKKPSVQRAQNVFLTWYKKEENGYV